MKSIPFLAKEIKIEYKVAESKIKIGTIEHCHIAGCTTMYKNMVNGAPFLILFVVCLPQKVSLHMCLIRVFKNKNKNKNSTR